MTRRQQEVLAFIRQHAEQAGRTPTLDEIGRHFEFTSVAAWKHVKALIEQRRLSRSGTVLVLAGTVDLTAASTAALRAELARRKSPSRRVAA